MKFLFYLGHPAHFHLFKHVISGLQAKNHQVVVLIKQKDVLERLLQSSGMQYTNIQPEGRPDTKAGIAFGLAKRDWQIFRHALKYKPDLMIGTSTEITHAGKLLGIPSVNVNEDDWDAVPLFSKLGYPWASTILTPESCPAGKWEYKSIKYPGYHELAYLHPDIFIPDKKKIQDKIDLSKPYFIIRFAKLTAHHDQGKSGIHKDIAAMLIKLFKPKGNIYITSERVVEPEFEKYRIAIDPSDMHHALFYANLYVGDSQTMAAEAAVLGTPSVRFNDFVGRLGYLEELEHKYKLTYGIKTNSIDKLLKTVEELLNHVDIKRQWNNYRKFMLDSTINVTEFMIWFFENYPSSVNIYKNEPDFLNRFK